MPRGRPTRYTQEIADAVCAAIASGKSLRASVADNPDWPPITTIIQWVLDDREGFTAQYSRARRTQAELLADELFTITDNESRDVDPDGKHNSAASQRDRLKADTRKWYLSKVLPKVYGEKLDLSHSGEVAIKRVVADL